MRRSSSSSPIGRGFAGMSRRLTPASRRCSVQQTRSPCTATRSCWSVRTSSTATSSMRTRHGASLKRCSVTTWAGRTVSAAWRRRTRGYSARRTPPWRQQRRRRPHHRSTHHRRHRPSVSRTQMQTTSSVSVPPRRSSMPSRSPRNPASSMAAAAEFRLLSCAFRLLTDAYRTPTLHHIAVMARSVRLVEARCSTAQSRRTAR